MNIISKPIYNAYLDLNLFIFLIYNLNVTVYVYQSYVGIILEWVRKLRWIYNTFRFIFFLSFHQRPRLFKLHFNNRILSMLKLSLFGNYVVNIKKFIVFFFKKVTCQKEKCSIISQSFVFSDVLYMLWQIFKCLDNTRHHLSVGLSGYQSLLQPKSV